MKTISVNVSEPVYEDFMEYARKQDRTAAELIREAMEQFRNERMRGRQSLLDLKPLKLGKPLRDLSKKDDLLEEMLDARD
jgi:hypothetical protein